jgi:P-type E1-E2 ATPase
MAKQKKKLDVDTLKKVLRYIKRHLPLLAVSILLATLISTFSEYRSERAFAKLFESCGAEKCRVRRNGEVCEVPADEIVVGDVVLLGAGEKIPADGVVLSGNFTVDQSALTGESREVEKRAWQRGEREEPNAAGAVFAGAALLGGGGEMRVTRVGDATFLGGISGELQERKRESPLKARLAQLATQISRIGTPKQNATYYDVTISIITNLEVLPGMNAVVTLK